MRKILLILLACILALVFALPVQTPQIAEASAILQDYYNTNDDDAAGVYTPYWCAQTFTTSSAYTITSVNLKLKRSFSPGIVTVSIKATSANLPTGVDLTSGTTDGNTLTTATAGEWREIALAPYALSDATKYAICVRVAASPPNNLLWRMDASSPSYTNGSRVTSNDGGSSWTEQTPHDLMFETYSIHSAAPTVTTNDATYVTTSTARLNSYLSSDGGGGCEVRFEYNTSSGAPYAYNTTWVDGYTAGQSPYADVGNLTENTTYSFRVQANNSAGLTNGSEKSFTTEATTDAPTNFVALPASHNVSLSWVKSVGAENTMVRFQLGEYPATNASGTQIYLGSSNTYEHTGLSPGTTYYYRAWGESAGNYTEDYASVMVTTLAGVDPGTGPGAPTYPSLWWQSPNYENMENVPGYEIMNGIADVMHMPYATWWLIAALGFCMTSGLFLYSRTRNLALSALTVAVFIVVAAIIGLLPLWMVFVFVIIALGLSAKAMR